MDGKRSIRTALITGISGSGGSYLAEYIIQNHPEVEVHGLSRWHSSETPRNLTGIREKIHVHECDLNDFSAILNTLKKVRPDAIFHLASHANVRTSFVNPLSVLQNNIMGTANLFEAVRCTEMDPVIKLCSSSEVYGQVDPRDVPISEAAPLNPASPYAVSKVAQDLLGATYFRSYGMKIIRTRMFTYLNPKRADLFGTSFAMQVARIEVGKGKELQHGNLESVRTVIDVRDAMRAYWLAAIHCKPGEVYNIGGDKILTVGGFLELLKKQAAVPIPSRLERELLRPADVTLQIPNTDKFTSATGWSPKYSFQESVVHLLAYCREVVSQEAEPEEGGVKKRASAGP